MASVPKPQRIVDGPSKLGLFLAFLDHKPDGKSWRTIFFETKDEAGDKTAYEVIVQTAAFEDGSGESWCLKGSINSWANSRATVVSSPPHDGRDVCGKVDIYFSTKNRTGTMTFLPRQ